jgi:hypothetical protein
MTLKQTAKKVIPDPLWKLGSDSYWWWRNRGRHLIARDLSPIWRENRRRLETYRDCYRGKRCFIIGNGPSLQQTDLNLLRDEYTFGLNRIYLLFPELGFQTSFLVSVNEYILDQFAQEFSNLSLPRFLTWRSRKWFARQAVKDQDLLFIDSDFTGVENFFGDALGRLFEGFTVTYIALQLAFFMGFEQSILVGVDHNFATKGPANQVVVSTGNDPNHFTPGYFGKGVRWQLPDLDGSERAYRMALEAYAKESRQVLDATVGGKLTVFPKVSFTELFSGKK